MFYQSALGQISMQADRARPYQPQVPGAEFGLGVRWRLALTSEVLAGSEHSGARCYAARSGARC